MIPNSRRLHRWISAVASIFFFIVSITGVILQDQQIFGEDEQRREQLAPIISAVTLEQPFTSLPSQLDAARGSVRTRYGDQPVSAIDWHIKGDRQFFIFHLDGPIKRKVTVDSQTAKIVGEVPDAESFILRLHTGEILGDGGKFLGLLWGIALIVMTYTGCRLYLQMYQARKKQSRAIRWWHHFFW